MISGESRRGEMISFAGTAGSVRRGALGDSAAYAEVRDAAVAGDERVGVAVRSLGTWRIGYFAPGTPATLRRERRLATPKDGLRPGSLAFAADGARLEWRSRTGRRRSVSLPAAATAAAP
jgi:hypothetical protein